MSRRSRAGFDVLLILAAIAHPLPALAAEPAARQETAAPFPPSSGGVGSSADVSDITKKSPASAQPDAQSIENQPLTLTGSNG